MIDRLLTFGEVAAELGCSVSTVKRRVGAGAFPVFDDGGLVRVRSSDLQRYVTEHVRRRHVGEQGVAARSPAGVVVPGKLTD